MTLSIRELNEFQSRYGVITGDFYLSEVTFEEYIAQCRIYISNNLPDEYTDGTWDDQKKTEHLLTLTRQFVEAHKINVKGYSNPDGTTQRDLLEQDVVDTVTGMSVLREALEDPEVDEIQINDMYTIFVSKGGRLEYYYDKHGRHKQFTSDEEITIMLNRILDDGTASLPQLTKGNQLLNAKTAKDQYRVNAVHHSANARDKPPHSFPVTNVTLRKFKKVKLTIDDLVANGACTRKMGRLLLLLGRAQLALFCVGPTGSGKTTLLNIIANQIPRTLRILLIQNPTEIVLVDRDEFNRNKFNAVHHEVDTTADSREDSDVTATAPNLVSNALRETPDIIIMGESRTAKEFGQCLRSMQTGQKIMGTFHAEDAVDAVGRFASEMSSLSGGDYDSYKKLSADKIDVVIAQHRFLDGRRRVMEITVSNGVDANGEISVTKLFQFILTGETRINEFGLEETLGHFEQTGYLDEKIQRKFYMAGISRREIAEFIDPKELTDELKDYVKSLEASDRKEEEKLEILAAKKAKAKELGEDVE